MDVYTDHNSLQYVYARKELNIRQRRWLELLKYYEMCVLDNTNKANVVADTLNHMTMGRASHVEEGKKDLAKDVQRFARLGVRLEYSTNGCFVVHNNSELSLVVKMKSKQQLDPQLIKLRKWVLGKLNESFTQRIWCGKVQK